MSYRQQGFTLIEILIALSIFALLATITSSSLYYAFNIRSRVNTQAERLNELQLALSIVQQDITQIVARAVRGNEMRLFPIFVGSEKYLEFTHEGNINPKSIEQRSTLKRIALVCVNNTLVHRNWAALDTVNRNHYRDKVLIDGVTDCHFNYLNQNNQLLSLWREEALTQNQKKESLPKAIQINMTLKDWGNISLLYSIPGALYGAF